VATTSEDTRAYLVRRFDEHADDRQMDALPAIIGGRAGGFPGWLNEYFRGRWAASSINARLTAINLAALCRAPG
jgi:hypothetical protein